MVFYISFFQTSDNLSQSQKPVGICQKNQRSGGKQQGWRFYLKVHYSKLLFVKCNMYDM